MTHKKLISGHKWILHIMECMGLGHLNARRVVIDAACDSAVTVYVECFGSDDLLNVEPPEMSAIDVKIVN